MTNTTSSANSTSLSTSATLDYLTTNCMDRFENQASRAFEPSPRTTMGPLEVSPSIVVPSYNDGSEACLTPPGISSGRMHQSSDEEGQQLLPDFDATRCLFCLAEAPDFDSNVSHMFKSHNFRVPDQHRLLVDLGTLYEYLYLIISVYAECLYCGTERRNSHGARHHMLAKNHCQIDIASQDSEFREFYDWDSDSDNNTEVDETTLRLSTGKMLSDRSVRLKNHRGKRSPHIASTSPERIESPADIPNGVRQPRPSSDRSVAPLKSSEKRDLLLLTQLARLRPADRISLVHLPVSQQRAQLLIWKKQMDQIKRSQQSSKGRLEQKENKTSVKNFVSDTHSKKGDHHHGKIWTP